MTPRVLLFVLLALPPLSATPVFVQALEENAPMSFTQVFAFLLGTGNPAFSSPAGISNIDVSGWASQNVSGTMSVASGPATMVINLTAMIDVLPVTGMLRLYFLSAAGEVVSDGELRFVNSGWNGNFFSVVNPNTQFPIDYAANVPEPPAVALVISAVAAAIWRRRRAPATTA